MQRRITFALGTIILAGCGHRGAPSRPLTPAVACAPQADAEVRVVKAIVDMYAAFKADDLVAFHAVAAPDFYAFDGGKRFDGDALSKTLASAHASGRRFEWTVTEPTVHVSCNTALITYVNVGAIGDAAGMQPISWLESAALRFDAGTWRIQFFHSTRVSPPR